MTDPGRLNLRSVLGATHLVIMFVPDVARWLGSIEAALVLQQIVYLADDDGTCVFGSPQADQFAIGRRAFMSARELIERQGFATAKRVGAVPRLEWQIDFGALQAAWEAFQSQIPDRDSGDARSARLETREEASSSRANRAAPTSIPKKGRERKGKSTSQDPEVEEDESLEERGRIPEMERDEETKRLGRDRAAAIKAARREVRGKDLPRHVGICETVDSDVT